MNKDDTWYQLDLEDEGDGTFKEILVTDRKSLEALTDQFQEIIKDGEDKEYELKLPENIKDNDIPFHVIRLQEKPDPCPKHSETKESFGCFMSAVFITIVALSILVIAGYGLYFMITEK